MKHFSLTEWADFARGVADKVGKDSMQAHLDSGCKRCRGELRTWTRMGEVARRVGSYEPPESATRTAKGLLPLHGRPGRLPLVRVLFDSLRTPLAAGIRSTVSTARQMLYGVGSYRIDVRMEPQMDSDKVSLVGQILNAADPVKTDAEVAVTLLRGTRILAESSTNALGEFHLEFLLEGQLQLQLALPGSCDVRIPLLVPSEASMTGLLEKADSKKVKGTRSRGLGSTRKKG